MSSDLSPAPRTVFVAGGTSGINLAIAQRFAEAGDRVAVVSRNPDKVAAAVEALGGPDRSMGGSVDVRDAEALQRVLEAVSAAWGPIDVVISGAAGNFVVDAASMSANAFKTVVDIDLLGTFNVLRQSWPYLRKPGASLLSLTAAQSWLPTPGQAHVGAAKAGIDQLTRTLAVEWGAAGVRVNSLAPGPVGGTEGMARLAPTAEALESWARTVPLGRLAEMRDITDAVMWLSSDHARFITGVTLSVDGGMSLGGSSAIARAMGVES